MSPRTVGSSIEIHHGWTELPYFRNRFRYRLLSSRSLSACQKGLYCSEWVALEGLTLHNLKTTKSYYSWVRGREEMSFHATFFTFSRWEGDSWITKYSWLECHNINNCDTPEFNLFSTQILPFLRCYKIISFEMSMSIEKWTTTIVEINDIRGYKLACLRLYLTISCQSDITFSPLSQTKHELCNVVCCCSSS